MTEGGQAEGEGGSGHDAHGGVQGGGDDRGQSEAFGHVQGPVHPAQRGHLEDGDVGGAPVDDLEWVGRQPDRLVGGDGHVDGAAQVGQVVDGGAGLFGVLQPSGGSVHEGQVLAGGVQVPGAVDVDTHLAGTPQGRADRLEALQVRRALVAAAADFDLGSPGSGGPHQIGGVLSTDLRDGHVDGDGLAVAGKEGVSQGLAQSGGEPGSAGLQPVVPEGRDLAPAPGAVEQDAVAAGDAAKRRRQRNVPDDRAVDAIQQSGGVLSMKRGDVDLAVGMLMVRTHGHRIRTIFNQDDETGTRVAGPTSANIHRAAHRTVRRRLAPLCRRRAWP